MKLFVFKSKDKYIGIESEHIYRIIDDYKVTPVCLTPKCYAGLIFYRGELFDVINIKLLLGSSEYSENAYDELIQNQRIIIVKWHNKKLAVIPDEIIGMIWIDGNFESLSIYQHEDKNINLITPDYIWKKLSELSYGYH
ncbi:MAG: chemotaxis protein CheW [Pseudomonadota bacterium]